VTETFLSKDKSELEEVLTDGLGYVGALKSALIEERNALENRDTTILETTAKSKQTLAKNLAMFDFFRADIESLANEQSGSLLVAWNEFQTIARDCDAMNRTNGAIIRARYDQLATGLSLLQGRDKNSNTYTPSGSTVTSTGRRSLTEA
jgi:flagellar biosynthesis/type III secretory pathway chaperone